MKLYKLTDKNGFTRNKTHWAKGITHKIEKSGITLCSNQVIHAYTSPLLAEFMNPAHSLFEKDKLLFECEGNVVNSDGTKVGVKELTITSDPISQIIINTTQRVAFGILNALEVYHELNFKRWAESWLNNIDRSTAVAAAVAADAANAAADAANAAADAAVAATAANAAADTAVAANTAAVAATAAATTTAAAAATAAATAIVYAAAIPKHDIDFQLLAEKAMTYV